MHRLLVLAIGSSGCWVSTPATTPAIPIAKPSPAPTAMETGRTCELADRTIVVTGKDVIVYSPAHAVIARAPIARTEHLGDRCDGPGGGHAGCSIHYDRFWSAAIPNRMLEFGNNAGNVLTDDEDAQVEECRPGAER